MAVRVQKKKKTNVTKSPRAELKRRQILDAAADVIARRGYANTMLSEIAAQIRTQAGSIYYHFESREHLFDEVLRQGVEDAHAYTRQMVAKLPKTASALDRLETAIRAHLELQMTGINNYSRATHRIFGEIPDDMRQRVRTQQNAYGRYLQGLIDAAMDAGDIEKVDRSVFLLLLLGAVNWVPQWFNPKGRLSARDICDLAVRMVFEGLATPKGKSNRGRALKT